MTYQERDLQQQEAFESLKGLLRGPLSKEEQNRALVSLVLRRITLSVFCAFLVSMGWKWVPIILFILFF